MNNEKNYNFKITPDVEKELVEIEISVDNQLAFKSAFSTSSIDKIIKSLVSARRKIVFKVPGFD